jgi:SAM-dependent methyltransferase
MSKRSKRAKLDEAGESPTEGQDQEPRSDPPPPTANEMPSQIVQAVPIVSLGEHVSPTETEQISVTPSGIRRSSLPPPAPDEELPRVEIASAPLPGDLAIGARANGPASAGAIATVSEPPAADDEHEAIEEIEPEPDSEPPAQTASPRPIAPPAPPPVARSSPPPAPPPVARSSPPPAPPPVARSSPPPPAAAAAADEQEAETLDDDAIEEDPREAKTPAEGVPAVRSAPGSAEPQLETAAGLPGDRPSDNPPEVEPEDVEIDEPTPALPGARTPSQPSPAATAPPASPGAPAAPAAPPAAIAAPAPVPLTPTRGPNLAAVVQLATQQPSTRRRPRYWWDELFGDDFLRTLERLSDRQIQAEADFIEESLSVQKGGIILDLACGTGRHAVELASRGYNVVGYDLSLAMLARAADEAHDRNQKLNFLQGDMRDMGFEDMFDGVYCWSTSFGYFDDEKNLLVAQNVHRALRRGGMLLLDVANRDFLTANEPSNVWFEGDSCVCMDEMRVDFIASRLRVKRMVMLDDGRSRELDYSIRLYSLHELGRLLHDVGFKVTEVSGHAATPGVFFGGTSPRIIVLAEKS